MASPGRYQRRKEKLQTSKFGAIPHPGPRPEGESAGLLEWKDKMRAYVLQDGGFKYFVQENGRVYDYYAPLHDRMCDKFEATLPRPGEDKVQRRSLRQYPRGTLKTTVGIEMLAWAIIKNPKIQMHYVRTTADLAANALFELRNESLATPFVRDLWGDITENLTLDNQYELSIGTNKDPTVRAVGITGAITGTHVHFVWLDDIVTDENFNSAKLRRNINSRMAQYRPILHPVYGCMMLSGTYWPAFTYHDQVVTENERLKKLQKEALERGDKTEAEALFHKMWDIDIAGVHNPDGTLLFPTKLTESFLRLVREDKDEGRFYAGWYEMVPASEDRKLFPKDKRKFFNGQLYHDPVPHLQILDNSGDTIQDFPVDVYMTLDPTLTAEDSSDSVGLVINAVDYDDNWHILVAKGFVEIPSTMTNIICMYLKVFRPIKLGIEPGALSGEMVSDIRHFIDAEELHTRIEDLKHLQKTSKVRNKNKRIEAMDTRYMKGKISLQSGPWCVQLSEAFDEWPRLVHFDTIDALSMMSGGREPFAKPCALEFLSEAYEDEEIEEDEFLDDWRMAPWRNVRVAAGAPQEFQDQVKEMSQYTLKLRDMIPPERTPGKRIGGHAGPSAPTPTRKT